MHRECTQAKPSSQPSVVPNRPPLVRYHLPRPTCTPAHIRLPNRRLSILLLFGFVSDDPPPPAWRLRYPSMSGFTAPSASLLLVAGFEISRGGRGVWCVSVVVLSITRSVLARRGNPSYSSPEYGNPRVSILFWFNYAVPVVFFSNLILLIFCCCCFAFEEHQ